MLDIISNFFKETGYLWLEVSPYLLLGIIISGLLHIFLGKEFISHHLGRGGVSSVVKASVFGVPLPVCSCGVIPLANSLRRDGAHKSSVLSFLVSTPTTGVDAFFASYSLLGPLFAIFRTIAAFVSGITLGLLDYFTQGKKEVLTPIPKHTHKKIQKKIKLKEFFRYTFIEIPNDIGKWLLVGTVIGGAISAFIPKELFSQYLSFPLDFLIALGVGIPLYVCSTGSIPIAASLIAKGFSPGAALIFLIVGPATNAITLSFVRAKLGKKSFYLYLTSIAVVALLLGLLFNFMWGFFAQNQSLVTGAGKALAFEYKLISSIILIGIIVFSLLRSKPKEIKCDLEFDVPDIHCQNCKLSLEGNLKKEKQIDDVSVDIHNKKIKIKGKIKRQKALDKIKKSGYNPKE